MLTALKKIDFYQVFTYFIILAFAGWIFETLAVLLLQGQLTDRGLLFISHDLAGKMDVLKKVPVFGNLPIVWGLPVIPIYGFGGIIMVYGFKGFHKNLVALFFVGMVSMTLFELLGSYFCQYVIHKQYWDYSTDFMNFQGRICLRSSIAWGVLSILASKLLTPELQVLYKKISRYIHFKILVVVLFVYFVFCAIVKYIVI